jgi:DNA repair exonuclease SbcCD ATPase subunit
MVIKKIKISQFKGIHALEFELGQTTRISGRNGSGKTTILDAIYWCLFGKNLEDAKDFGVKPYGSRNAEPTVELTIDVNGKQFKLRRTLKEKWTRVRGANELTLTGHETEYAVDDVIVSATQFNAFAEDITGGEQLFKVLSSPKYFSNYFNVKERRKMLAEALELAQIEQALKKQYELPEDVEGLANTVRAKKARLKDDLQQFPIRIAELEHSILEVPEHQKLLDEKQQLQAWLLELNLQEKAIAVHSEQLMQEYNRKLQEVEKQRQAIRKQFIELENRKTLAITKYQEDLAVFTHAQRQFEELQSQLERYTLEKNQLVSELESLRKEFLQVGNEIYQPITGGKCQYCGQPLPAEKLDEQNQKMQLEFNESKRRRLAQIEERGKLVRKQADDLEARLASITSHLNELASKIKQPQEPVFDERKKLELQQQLEAIKDPEPPVISTSDISSKREELNARINAIDVELAKIEINNKTRARITELNTQWGAMSNELAELERLEIKIDEYNVRLSQKVEDIAVQQIGDTNLKIRLYKVLLNKNLETTCDIVLVQEGREVPFKDLNHASQVHVGCKLIQFLSRKLNRQAPVIIDNAESLNQLPDVSVQKIATFVTESEMEIVNLD